jgi:hypothetical protein
MQQVGVAMATSRRHGACHHHPPGGIDAMDEHRRSFVVARDDLRRSRFIDEALPALGAGDVLLKVDRFAFTANNVAYAEMGERMA